ncbi:MAG: DUF2937 family protein [Neomegalonema sp.]|nr:DUF2937 family protein [Neomegalonema sp.]
MRQLFLFIVGVIGAGVMSQAPEFTTQYEQNLRGGVRELARAAPRPGEPDPRGLVERHERLDDQKKRLAEAGPFKRILELVNGFDIEIARDALEVFKPAVPITPEGGLMAGVGFFAGRGAALLFISGLGALLFRRRARSES